MWVSTSRATPRFVKLKPLGDGFIALVPLMNKLERPRHRPGRAPCGWGLPTAMPSTPTCPQQAFTQWAHRASDQTRGNERHTRKNARFVRDSKV
jgi:hypothetical protein